MGTPEFAVPSLRALVEAGYRVPLVITQPDRPAGRGKKLKPPPVKVEAERLGIPVYQPEKVKENEKLKELLEKISPDLIVVAAYGKILPDWLLNLPKKEGGGKRPRLPFAKVQGGFANPECPLKRREGDGSNRYGGYFPA